MHIFPCWWYMKHHARVVPWMAAPHHRWLQGWAKKKDMASGRLAHCLMIFDGSLDSLPLEADSLICLYSSCGSLFESSLVFCELSEPSLHTWHAIIHAFCAHGESRCVVEMYRKARDRGVVPNPSLFLGIVKACSDDSARENGRLVHDDVVRNSADADPFLRCALIDMYARCGNLGEARSLLDGARERDAALWGAMIYGYAQHSHGIEALELFEEMRCSGVEPTSVTFLCVLKACSSIGAAVEGMVVHDEIVRARLERDLAIANALVDMYARCGSLTAACRVFDGLPNPNQVSYGGLIAAYAQHGQGSLALECFAKLRSEGIAANRIIYVCVLKACSSMQDAQQGKVLHDCVVRSGFESDVTIANTLIDVYAKCGFVEEARRVFDLLRARTTVSWGAMIAGYVQGGHASLALELFNKMQKENLRPDQGAIVSMLKACAGTEDLLKGRMIHEAMIEHGVALDTLLGCSLIDMYSKCGDMDAAERVFDGVPRQDVAAWSAIITGHVQHEQHRHAFELFKKMLQEGVKPDRVVFLCILKACSSIGAFNLGKTIHDQIKRCGFDSDAILSSSLIDMYAKCGNVEEARIVFEGMVNPDAVAWSALIAGYAHNGKYKEAKECIEKSERLGVLSSKGSLCTILSSACSHGGNIDKAQRYLTSSIEDDDPDADAADADDDALPAKNRERFNCLIDLLARSGKLHEAERMLQSMPLPSDIVGWTALLTSCKIYGNPALAKECLENITQLDPCVSYGHILLSHIYADAPPMPIKA